VLGLLALCWLPVMCLVALVTLCQGWGKNPRTLVPVLLAIGFEAVLLLGAAWEVSRLKYPSIDYSPEISAEELVGNWQSRVGTLSLNADGTFQRSSGEHGQWSVQRYSEHGVQIGGGLWCALRVDRQLQLLRPEDCQWDPDNWRYSRAFTRRH